MSKARNIADILDANGDVITSALGNATVTEFAQRPASDYGVGTGGTTNTYTENSINYKSHTFTSSGTFTVTTAGYFDIMLVAGGGGGSGYHGSGGGAGNVVIINDTISTGAYSIVIGAGGTSDVGGVGYKGADTTGFGETAFGGGGGAKYNATQGMNGGCGGGGASQAATAYGQGGAGSSGKLVTKEGFRYGHPAGTSHFHNHTGAGGGGAGAMGEHGNNINVAGNGGVGMPNTYRTGSSVYYGGGGGGGIWGSSYQAGTGGSGGGGNGSTANNYNPTAGAANTGGGGGGQGGQTGGAGGAGGSGIVVIRYRV